MRTQLVKAFTKHPRQGNPAGVVVDASNMSDEQKQAVATKLNFSESAFVEPSNIADFKVRFFSPTQEVSFCGHATVATFHSLIDQQRIVLGNQPFKTVTQETGIGVLPVTCYVDGKIMMTQQLPEFAETFAAKSQFAQMMGIDASAIADSPIQITSTGARQLIVVVKGMKHLKAIQPNFEQIIDHSKQYDHAGLCVITEESFSTEGDLATRNFAPVFGIKEDPATGIAAGAIGWYANKYLYKQVKKSLIIEQGFDMDAASTIFV